MDDKLIYAALLVFTNVFWALIVTALVNRLMSRNYFEFKEANSTAEKKAGKLKVDEPPQVFEDDSLGRVTEIM